MCAPKDDCDSETGADRAVLSNGPAGPGLSAPKPQGAPKQPCVIFHLVK